MAHTYILRSTLFKNQIDEWVLIDTETNGLISPIYIIQIAGQKFKGLEPVGESFHAFINHDIEIAPAATAIHGFTTDFIRENGISPELVYNRFREFIGNLPICAHFLQFDWTRALVPELARLKIPVIGIKGFCTWSLARRTLPELKSHRLDLLRDFFNLDCSRAHTATGDIQSTVDLLTRIVFPRLIKLGYKDINEISDFAQLNPILKCHCIIKGISFEKEIQRQLAEQKAELAAVKEEKKRLEAIEHALRKVAFHNYYRHEELIEIGLMEEFRKIVFEGRGFQFTGRMKYGTRAKAIAEIIRRGGRGPRSKISLKTEDYLVLGEDPMDSWTSRVTKLSSVILDKLRGKSYIEIILESDFVAALEEIATET